MPDNGFRWMLIGLACVNTIICIFLEDVLMEKGFQSVWKKFGPKSKTRYNEIESWMQGHPEWPILSSPKMHSREKATSPVSKSYPFTVEVIAEGKDDSLQQKLDFSPKMRRNNDDDIHSNAAIVLNSTSVS